MKRRQFLRGAAVSAGAVALAGIPSAAGMPTDPTIAAVEEWLRLDHLSHEGMTQADSIALRERESELMDYLLETRGTSLEGVHAKLRMLFRWQGLDNPTLDTETDFGAWMPRSLLEDVAQMLATGKPAGS